MKLALAGATGNIGSRVLDEALRRGHAVTAISRDPAKLGAREGMTAARGDTGDAAAFAKVLANNIEGLTAYATERMD